MQPSDIINHCMSIWGGRPRVIAPPPGPLSDPVGDFTILEFAPSARQRLWIYATCGMSKPTQIPRLEIFMFAPFGAAVPIGELLAATAYYHLSTTPLGVGHIVNFGQPWLPGSACRRGLLSVPYIGGPKLEWLGQPETPEATRFLWLIPITDEERAFAKLRGLNALEEQFEERQFEYWNPSRPSVVERNQ